MEPQAPWPAEHPPGVPVSLKQFVICSFGCPATEAAPATQLLTLADERMYIEKNHYATRVS